MKITKRQLLKLINEALNDSEAQFFGPVFAEVIADYEDPKNADIFKDYQSLMIHNSKYPKLSMLGSGAFRITFEDTDDPRFLLKVAKPGKRTSIQDNTTEINAFNQFPEIFPKIYYSAPDNRFFIIERVEVLSGPNFTKTLEAKFPDVFQKIKSLPRFINSGVDPYENSSNKTKDMWRDLVCSLDTHRLNENFDEVITSPDPNIRKAAVNIFKIQFYHKSAKAAYTTEEICEIIEDTSFKRMFNIVNSLGIAFRELRGDNMGLTNEGRLVIIDNSQLDKVGPITNINCSTPVRVDKDVAIHLNPDAEAFDPVVKQGKKNQPKQAPPPKLPPGKAKGGTADFYGAIFDPSSSSIDPDQIPTDLDTTDFDIEAFVERMKEKNRKEKEKENRDGISGQTLKTGAMQGTLGTGVMGEALNEYFKKFLKDITEWLH